MNLSNVFFDCCKLAKPVEKDFKGRAQRGFQRK